MLLRSLLQRAQKVPTASNPLFGLFGLGKESKTGVDVNEEEALSSSAVWSAITQLSQYVASLPLHYYKRLAEGKEKYTNSSLYNLLHLQPNPEMTSMAYREAQMGQVLFRNSKRQSWADYRALALAYWSHGSFKGERKRRAFL